MKTTLKDIAEATGYSIPTVSRVLNNGDKFYSDDTARIILEAAHKMNYKPNIMARGLKTGKSYSIAMLVPQLDDFYDSIFRTIQHRLNENGYSLAIFSSDYDEKIERLHLKSIKERNYDGVIVVTGFLEKKLNENPEKVFGNTPVIMLERKYRRNENIASVSFNVKKAMKEVVNYLVALGHRRIAFIAAPERFDTISQRREGYLEGLIENGITPDESLIIFDEAFEKTDYSVLYNFMSKIFERTDYTAIVSSSDFAAFASLRIAQQRGIRIPQDVSLVGFDDIVYTQYTIPSLSTVSQDTKTLGEEAAQLLLNVMNGKKKEQIIIDCKLSIRESVGPCKILN